MVDEAVTGAPEPDRSSAVAARVGAVEDVIVAPDGLEGWFETFRITPGRLDLGQPRRLDQGDEARVRPWRQGALRVGGVLSMTSAVEAARIRATTSIRARIARGRWGRATSSACRPRRVWRRSRTHPVDDIEIRYRHQAMHLLCIAGLGGLPQISLPMAELDGLPLGVSLNGPRGADLQLLEAGPEDDCGGKHVADVVVQSEHGTPRGISCGVGHCRLFNGDGRDRR